MLRVIQLTAGAGLLVLTLGCSGDSSTEVKAVRARSDAWSRAAAARDRRSFTAFYAEDAAAVLPYSWTIDGDTRIGWGVAQMMGDPNFALTLTTQTADASDSLAYTKGDFRLTTSGALVNEGRPSTVIGHYLTVWKEQHGGTWKIVQNIFYLDPPRYE
jgi:ketosteroid isomerase-like protein